jgi:hypothetical protein
LRAGTEADPRLESWTPPERLESGAQLSGTWLSPISDSALREGLPRGSGESSSIFRRRVNCRWYEVVLTL